MMKKTYNSPEIKLTAISQESIITLSGVSTPVQSSTIKSKYKLNS